MQDGSSAQALPSTLPRSPVPAGSKSGPFGMCRAQQMVPTGTGPSSGTRQTKSLFLPEVQTVSRKHLLPRHALLVQPILEKWGNDVAEFPLLQASVNPSRIVTEKAVPLNVTRATPGYY